MAARTRKIVWTDSARTALSEVLEDIATDSVDSAIRVLTRTLETTDSLTQLVRGQRKTGKNPEASSVGDGRREIRPRNAAHAGLENGIVNAQEITEPGVENRARC